MCRTERGACVGAPTVSHFLRLLIPYTGLMRARVRAAEDERARSVCAPLYPARLYRAPESFVDLECMLYGCMSMRGRMVDMVSA